MLRRVRTAVRRPLPRRPRRAGRRRRRGDGHDAAGRPTCPSTTSQGHEGCNEILNVTRPDVVARRARAYFAVGRGRGGDQHVRREPGQPRRVRHRGPDPRAGRGGRADRPRGGRRLLHAGPPALRARLGRPGHQAADAGPRALRHAARRLPEHGRRADRRRRRRACSSRPARTCCRPRRRCSAPRRAMAAEPAARVPIIAQVTVETTGTMLLGSEIGAALTALEPLGHRPDRAQLRHRPRRDERAPAPPVAEHARVAAVGACPTPACRSWAPTAREYPLTPDELAEALRPRSSRDYGAARWSAAAAAPPPSTSARGRRARSRGRARRAARTPRPSRRVARSTSRCRSAQDTVGADDRASAPTPTAPRRSARRCWPSDWDDCVEIAREQTRDGAHLLDLCVDYVGRDGVADMARAGRPAGHRVHAADHARLHRAGRARGRAGAASAAAAWSTRSTTRTATAPTRGSQRIDAAGRASTAPRSSR